MAVYVGIDIHKRFCQAALMNEDGLIRESRFENTLQGASCLARAILLSEIGDVKRFPTSEKLVSWVGLAPQVHQSGETHWTGHITRKGSKRARWILIQCAQSARQHDPKMREFYERIDRKNGSSKATVAVARKMLAIMHVMLTRNEPYHGMNS